MKRTGERLVRLHCVNALFSALTGHDLYLAEKLLQGADAAVALGGESSTTDLAELLDNLHQRLFGGRPEVGFAFCDGGRGDAVAGPLFLRAQLLAAVRRNAPRAAVTIVVGNLPIPPAATDRRRRRKRSREEEHADLVAHLRALVATRANPRSHLTFLVL